MKWKWNRLYALVGTSLPLKMFLWLNKKATDEYKRNEGLNG